VKLAPPSTPVGETANESSWGRFVGSISSVAVSVTLLACAMMVALCEAAVVGVEMVKFAAAWPCGTVTIAGAVTVGTLLRRETGNPLALATPFSATVPVRLAPPRVSLVESVRPVSPISLAGRLLTGKRRCHPIAPA
jgi:hypothetical protein